MAFDQRELFGDAMPTPTPYAIAHPLEIAIDGIPVETTPVFRAYWYFACERQRMFRRRLTGSNRAETSEDPILAMHRFTNAYRASDRVSQYLIRHVIGKDTADWSREDIFFRILMFKIFNRIDTWEAITGELGQVCLRTYDFRRIDDFLADRMRRGHRNYSAAYIMPSAGRVFGHASKHANHLRLIEWMLETRFPDRLSQMDHMSEAFDLLVSAPSIGPFLAYQFATDLNYSDLTGFSEMEYVVAGPGALDGISKCFADTHGLSPEQIIAHMTTHQSGYFEHYDFDFPDLWGRPLQLIDCQNIFCEISKYARAAFPEIAGKLGRSRIKQKYKPAGQIPPPWYPPKWGLNAKIAADDRAA